MARVITTVCVWIVCVAPAYADWTWTTLDYPGAETTSVRAVSGSNMVALPHSSSLYKGSTWNPVWNYAVGISGNIIVGYFDDGFLTSGTRFSCVKTTSLAAIPYDI